MTLAWCVSGALAANPTTDVLQGLVRIDVYPEFVSLRSARAETQLVVTGHYADGTSKDLTRQAEFLADRPGLVRVDAGRVLATDNGRATMAVRVGDHEARVSVTTTGAELPDPVRFGTEVLAVLTKQGCNAGSCHGSPEGKGGFPLSLMAYAPAMDEEELIRGGQARRISPIEPEESLLLKKPLLKVAHVGGKRLLKSDLAYQILHDWISEGANPDPAGAPQCVGISIHPVGSQVLKLPDAAQQLSVQAKFSDGSVMDITRLATYDTSNKELLTCDATGRVRGRQRGVGAITVRYLQYLEAVNFTIVQDVPGFVWNDPPENGEIDRWVHAKLKQLHYLPSEDCDDRTFVRRIHLDLTGLLPTAGATRQFLADSAPDKRARLIDALLDSEEFARFWAQKDADLMRVNEMTLQEGRADLFASWLRDAWRSNVPYDRFARDLLTASGDTKDVAPANFFYAIPSNEDVTETTSQLFMGSRINCAKCHNHPFESWTQDDYYRIAAVFVRTKNDKGTIVVNETGEAMHPKTGQAMEPWGAKASQAGEDPLPADRRQWFADWLTHRDNPYFSKVAANRIWSHLMGRGIVEPVDDFRSSNPAVNPELLEMLAEELERSHFDRKHLIRLICNSRTYQRSSATNAFNADDTLLFSHYRPRRLSAEQLHDAVGLATQALGPTGEIASRLETSSERLAMAIDRLPQDREHWERSLTERVTAIPCWQGTWHYTGSLGEKSFDAALASVHPPETDATLDFSAKYNDGKIAWKEQPQWADNETALVLDGSPGPHYIARRIYANKAGPANLSLSANGSLSVWLNGEQVLNLAEKRALKEADVSLPVMLKAGANTLLVKSANAGGLWGFYYRLVDFDGAPPSFLKVKFNTAGQEGLEALVAAAFSKNVNGPGTLEIPIDVGELIVIPPAERTAAQTQKLIELQERDTPEISALKEEVRRLQGWLDYQTQRAAPAMNEFLVAFGQPKRETPCACERMNEPTIDQALQTLNGPHVRNQTAAGASRYATIADDAELLHELYIAALSRPPVDRELEIAGNYLKNHENREEAIQDLLWAVLNTREFQFQH